MLLLWVYLILTIAGTFIVILNSGTRQTDRQKMYLLGNCSFFNFADEDKANRACKELNCGESYYIPKSGIFHVQPSSRGGALQCIKEKNNKEILWHCMKYPYNQTCTHHASVICTGKCTLLYYYNNIRWETFTEKCDVFAQNTGDFVCGMATISAPGPWRNTMSQQDRGFLLAKETLALNPYVLRWSVVPLETLQMIEMTAYTWRAQVTCLIQYTLAKFKNILLNDTLSLVFEWTLT